MSRLVDALPEWLCDLIGVAFYCAILIAAFLGSKRARRALAS